MKKMIVIVAMVATTVMAKAQNPDHWDENTGRNVSSGNGNKFSDIEMVVDDKIISFTHIPKVPDEITAVITNAHGDEVAQKGITPLSNVIDLKNLRKGKTYFVTLVCNNKTQKAFTLHL